MQFAQISQLHGANAQHCRSAGMQGRMQSSLDTPRLNLHVVQNRLHDPFGVVKGEGVRISVLPCPFSPASSQHEGECSSFKSKGVLALWKECPGDLEELQPLIRVLRIAGSDVEDARKQRQSEYLPLDRRGIAQCHRAYERSLSFHAVGVRHDLRPQSLIWPVPMDCETRHECGGREGMGHGLV